jgi:hypothetical protein
MTWYTRTNTGDDLCCGWKISLLLEKAADAAVPNRKIADYVP